ncbi:MAG TPA: hypothetical protein VM802_00065 [Chitinophaga sp.]|uniref:hypothetical protein n=1 Tax=Chitinophaga sp. TaxID=1869181 RepID=UPI002CF9A330|nr:hypothetical protein [Chitinophaga sp.]HVI43222.1 hypothetical protein [Chitinophaga sp.]
MQSWMKPAEALLLKLSLHSSSINKLMSPVPLFKDENGNILSIQDISSIYVLSRAQIECYLTLYYFILSPSNDDEGEFKHLLYQLSGLSNRQNYYCTMPESIAKKQQEASDIARLRQQISNNVWYQNLPSEDRRKVDKVNPPSRLLGWERIIESTRFKETHLAPSWKLYSNHAHSEFIGTIQFTGYLSDNTGLKKTLYHTLELTIMIMCVTITELLNLFPVIADAYEALVSIKDRTYVCYWTHVGLKEGLH